MNLFNLHALVRTTADTTRSLLIAYVAPDVESHCPAAEWRGSYPGEIEKLSARLSLALNAVATKESKTSRSHSPTLLEASRWLQQLGVEVPADGGHALPSA